MQNGPNCIFRISVLVFVRGIIWHQAEGYKCCNIMSQILSFLTHVTGHAVGSITSSHCKISAICWYHGENISLWFCPCLCPCPLPLPWLFCPHPTFHFLWWWWMLHLFLILHFDLFRFWQQNARGGSSRAGWFGVNVENYDTVLIFFRRLR